MVASGDMAHATHPNYPERHEPGHLIAVNGGPVLKVQPNLRYATDSRTAAAFELACRQAGVPLQRYEHRADLPCGSTIGPMTAARTGIPTVDVGARNWPCTQLVNSWAQMMSPHTPLPCRPFWSRDEPQPGDDHYRLCRSPDSCRLVGEAVGGKILFLVEGDFIIVVREGQPALGFQRARPDAGEEPDAPGLHDVGSGRRSRASGRSRRLGDRPACIPHRYPLGGHGRSSRERVLRRRAPRLILTTLTSVTVDTVEHAAATPDHPQPYRELGPQGRRVPAHPRHSGSPAHRCRTRDVLGDVERALPYKSSKVHLRYFGETTTEQMRRCMLAGIGENAGVVDIGDGWAVTFKVESHNHPSYVEPYQGAATASAGSCATSWPWVRARSR